VIKIDFEDPKKAIISLLEKHPEGLMITTIAKEVGMNRLTAAKYIHELMGAGRIVQRKLGRVRLCYLKTKKMRNGGFYVWEN